MGVEQRSIFVTTSVVGFHYWPDAPLARGYLGEPHRHRFGIRVETRVDHDDRELEFHDLIDLTREALTGVAPVNAATRVQQFGRMSCEMIAERLAQTLRETLQRDVIVDVDEDGECGARVELPYP